MPFNLTQKQAIKVTVNDDSLFDRERVERGRPVKYEKANAFADLVGQSNQSNKQDMRMSQMISNQSATNIFGFQNQEAQINKFLSPVARQVSQDKPNAEATLDNLVKFSIKAANNN